MDNLRVKRTVAWVFLIATTVFLTGCGTNKNDPVAVARQYIKGRGKDQGYALLSADSKKATTQDDYMKSYGKDIPSYAVDAITVLPEDANLPTYRRVRMVGHVNKRSDVPPFVSYYTLINENGMWRNVWENPIMVRAYQFFQNGMYDEAISFYDQAIGLNPYSDQAYCQKAWCYFRLWNRSTTWDNTLSDAVLSNAQKAVDLNPENPDNYNMLANVYAVQQLPEQEIDCYQKAIHMPFTSKTQKLVYYNNIVGSLLNENQPTDALAFSDSALAIDSTAAVCLYRRATVEFALGKDSVANSYFNRAFNADWTSQIDNAVQVDLLYRAAQCEYRLQKYNAALGHVLTAIEKQPDNQSAHQLYTLIKSNMNK